MPRLNKVRGFNAAVRAAMMPRYVNRIRNTAFTITNNAVTRFRILKADDDPDHDQLATGTTPGEISVGSRLLAVQIHAQIITPLGDNELIEWLLVKDPDAALETANGDDIGDLYTQDTGTIARLLRKNTLAVGHIITDSNHATPTMTINIPRQVMRRAGLFMENDALNLVFTATAAAGDATLYVRGRTISRLN